MMVSSHQESMEELISALEKATLLTKNLPSSTTPSQLHQIYTSLHSAHHHLTMFLLNQSTPFPQPSPPPPQLPENSICSVDGGGDELMQGVNEGGIESSRSLDGVEEKMKDWCFGKNKRLKRMLSDEEEEEAAEGGGTAKGFGDHEKKLRALELIYQFHS